MCDSGSVKLRWALSSGTPEWPLPAASACPQPPELRPLTPPSPPVSSAFAPPEKPTPAAVHLRACSVRTAGPPPHQPPGPVAATPQPPRQLRFLLLHPTVTHRLVPGCVGPHLGPSNSHVTQLHQTRLPAQRQYLQEQARQRFQIVLAEVRYSAEIRRVVRRQYPEGYVSWSRWAIRRRDATPTQ